MRTRTLGPLTVSVIGLGQMQMSVEGRPAETQALDTIHAAVDSGMTLIDTADCYHIGAGEVGHGEELVSQALARLGRDANDVLVATKGGKRRPGDGSWYVDGRPDHLLRACEASLSRLRRDAIDLYQLHEPDPEVPFEDSVGALALLHEQGKVRALGISNVTADQIEDAYAILGDRLISVQNRHSAAHRESVEALTLCEQFGIAFLPFGPLGGRGTSSAANDAWQPFRTVAAERGVSWQRLAIASLLHDSPAMLPIPGASRPASARDSAGAADLQLDRETLSRLAGGPRSRQSA